MKLQDWFHCPHCKGHLAAAPADPLYCRHCEQGVRVVDGVADFAGDPVPPDAGSGGCRGYSRQYGPGRAALLTRIQIAASDRWPTSLGDAIEFGCGGGETTEAILAGKAFRSLLAVDTETRIVQACRSSVAASDPAADPSIEYAAVADAQDVLRDGVADTVIGIGLVEEAVDVRASLAMIHRVLRPNGRAMLVVPNRRYHEVMCLAMAEALVQRQARDGIWPEGQQAALELMAHTRLLLSHRDDLDFLSKLDVKHLFDSDLLEDLANEAGFSNAEIIPLDPDPAGAETMHRICQDAGAPDSFAAMFGPLAAAVGQPFFNLLARRDASASMLLWLTKQLGPSVRIFTDRSTPHCRQVGADAVLGGVAPRWSVEVLARDTPEGIAVALGGWCLCNSGVQWVRLTLSDVTRHAPVWRPRPDVHEVLNRNRAYHPLNTLCSGIDSTLLFEDVHPMGNSSPFRLDIVLASGIVMSGPAPERVLMDELMVIAH